MNLKLRLSLGGLKSGVLQKAEERQWAAWGHQGNLDGVSTKELAPHFLGVGGRVPWGHGPALKPTFS